MRWNITCNWQNSGHNIKCCHLLIFTCTPESDNRDVSKSKTWILQLRVTTKKKASQIKHSVMSWCTHNMNEMQLHLLTNTVMYNSNKSPNWRNNFPVYYPDVHLQLNMFRAFCPSSGAQWLQWQPLVLRSYRGNSRAVFVVGPASPTTNTARLLPRYEGKTRGCHCSHWAPDDGQENARNMLNCKWTSG